jgi:hypothetical protein
VAAATLALVQQQQQQQGVVGVAAQYLRSCRFNSITRVAALRSSSSSSRVTTHGASVTFLMLLV